MTIDRAAPLNNSGTPSFMNPPSRGLIARFAAAAVTFHSGETEKSESSRARHRVSDREMLAGAVGCVDLNRLFARLQILALHLFAKHAERFSIDQGRPAMRSASDQRSYLSGCVPAQLLDIFGREHIN